MFTSPIQVSTEKMCIAALLQYPNLFAELDGFIKNNDFTVKINDVIYSVIKDLSQKKEPVDTFSISNKIENLGIRLGINTFEYLESLSLIQIASEEASKSYFKELALISAKRKIYESAQSIQKYILTSKNDEFDEIIGKCDKLYGENINSFSTQTSPQDAFASIEEYIESNGNLEESNEIQCPYPLFQSQYGGFTNGLTLFVSAYKVGKSTFLLDLSMKLGKQNKDVEILYLDTEMSLKETQRRIVSSMSGVNEYYLRGPLWRKNEDLCRRVRATFPEVKKMFNKLNHLYVGAMSPEQTESVIKRWVWQKRAENPKCKPMVFLDYFKLQENDGAKDGFASSMILGYKVNRMKIISAELDIPIVSAAQSNANGEIGLSREMAKFVDSAFKLRLRTTDEIADEGGLATHKIETICNRSLGPDAKPFFDKIKFVDKDGKIEWRDNAILYKFDSFLVTEVGTLKQHMDMQIIPERKKLQVDSGDIF